MYEIAPSIWIPWVGSLIVFAIGIYQYADKRSQANKEPFLKEQFTLCFQASEAASLLSTERDPEKWDQARSTFWKLYFGPLCIVENREVEKAMVALGNRIPRPEQPRPAEVPITDGEFRNLSIQLAHATRRLIQSNWRIDLGVLGNRQA